MVEDSRLALRIRKGEAMEHYCKYCGRKLRRRESSCPICNGQRRRRHRKWPLVLAAALAVLMTAAIAVGLFWMRRRLMENQPSAEALRTQALTLRVDGVLSSPVEDAEAAASALCAAGKNLGFSNALAELTTYTTQTVEGITCYRMQQNFGGVPVYGRTVSLLTNEEGKTLLLAGNVEDLNENTICNQPRDGTADMAAALGAYYDGSEVELADAAPVLYLLQTENGWYYAHQVYAHVEGVGTVEALVDAESGQVLSTLQRERNVDTILESWSTIRNSDPDLRNIEGYLVRTTEGDDGYYLIDSVRNIYIYDLQGKKYDAEKKTGQWVWSENCNFEQEAAAYLYYLSLAYDYFYTLHGDPGYGILIGRFHDGSEFGYNCSGGRTKDGNGMVSLGKHYSTSDWDVIGHEYTHVISSRLVPWSDNQQAQSIQEGISDLYGCILEAYMTTLPISNAEIADMEPDWDIRSDDILLLGAYRDLRDPSESGNAEKLSDEKSFWSSDSSEYYYSTLISHAAYLMWNGIDGDEAARLNTVELSVLWYLAMQVFPGDIHFTECSDLVEAAAALLTARGYLTEAQLRCVSEAFERVEISGSIDAQETLETLREEAEQSDTEDIPADSETEHAEQWDTLPAGIPETLVFQSGAGGWWTELHLHQDGTFSGVYQDWNLGGVTLEMETEAGMKLPGGQCYRCDFTGQFSKIRKVSDVEYVMEMTELTYLNTPETHAVVDDAWIDYSEAYGLSGAKELRLYLPGRSTEDFSENLRWWLTIPHGWDELPTALEGWCLYNVEEDLAFYAEEAAPAQTAAEIWYALLASGEYRNYTVGWQEQVNNMPTDYALLDINGDGWDELILCASQGGGFSYHSVLCCDPDTGEITVVQIEDYVVSEAGYTEVAQHYGALRYSAAHHALAYTSLNNGNMFGSVGYFCLEGERLEVAFSVGFENFPDEEPTYYLYQDETERMTQAEYWEYLDELEDITFQPISIAAG